MLRQLRGIVSLIAVTPILASGQAFEVASVKLNRSGSRGGSMEFSRGGERFTATNMPFGALVLVAYDITVRQLSGPAGFLSEKYDVVAKAEHAVSPDEMLRMLQALLTERFKLVVRRETRDVPVYALTLGKGGPKMHKNDSSGSEHPGPRTPSRAIGTERGSGDLVFKNESMSDFAWALTRMAGIGDRVVVDDTGLKGTYDFELKFSRDRAPQTGIDGHEPAARLEDPTIFSALQEQLGLKLESRKGPVEFLVLEHVEKPSEN
jgi:uncharacterized protein (TIGR03435 family)